MIYPTKEKQISREADGLFHQVKMRFPTMDSLVEAKLLLPHEADRLEKVDFRSTSSTQS